MKLSLGRCCHLGVKISWHKKVAADGNHELREAEAESVARPNHETLGRGVDARSDSTRRFSDILRRTGRRRWRGRDILRRTGRLDSRLLESFPVLFEGLGDSEVDRRLIVSPGSRIWRRGAGVEALNILARRLNDSRRWARLGEVRRDDGQGAEFRVAAERQRYNREPTFALDSDLLRYVFLRQFLRLEAHRLHVPHVPPRLRDGLQLAGGQ